MKKKRYSCAPEFDGFSSGWASYAMYANETAMSSSLPQVGYDPELPVIEAIRQGDPQALAELITRQGRWVRGVIFAASGRVEDVEDIAQRVWLKVWQEAGRLEDCRRWRVWLYRISRNAATDAGRARQRRRRLLASLFQRNRREKCDGPPDGQLQLDEQHRAVLAAVSELPELYREPFVLRHLENWSYRQIGEAMGLPSDTVETRLVRARRLLREKLADKL